MEQDAITPRARKIAMRSASMVLAVVTTSVATALATTLIVLSAFPQRQPAVPAPLPTNGATAPVSSHEAAVEQAVAQAAPSVVSVVATKDLPVVERYFTNPFGNNDFFNQFSPFQFQVPQYRQNGTQRKEVAGGTGFLVSKDGLVLTNRHVVDIADADFTVVFSDGSKKDAKVLAKDPVEDLAVLKIDGSNFPALTLGDSGALKIGQSVIAIGNTLGEFQNTVSVGVVSGLNRKIVAGDNGGGQQEVIEGAIQTDAAINPGNSGGPLLNLHGEVIGIDSAIVVGSQNVGFAIPINKAKKAISDVAAGGKISRAFLGVRHVAVTKEIQQSRNLPFDYGALIVGSQDGKEPGVAADSPAAKAGLREGDVILSVNGQKVDDAHSLTSLISAFNVGATITLHVYASGSEKDVSVTLTERPQ